MFEIIKERINKLAVFIFKKMSFAAALLLFAAALMPTEAKADVVTDWSEIANTVIVTNAKRAPAAAIVDMAYVHAAIYDSVNAIDRRYTTYAVTPAAIPSPNTSKKAAAATAAYKILVALFPEQESFLTSTYTTYLQSIPESNMKTEGVALGNEIAAKLMLSRANDGREAAVPFTPSAGAGNWQPTPPTFAPTPLTPWVAKMRPFLLANPSQFRAEGPPALGSAQWATDYNETRALGALNSTVRTPEQTEIGLFYTEHAAEQYNRVFRQFAIRQNLDVADNARLFAMIYLAGADSLIAAWDSKFYFHFWRPVTAIRAGETDGNDSTVQDATWTPLDPTPPHPEYPAAHGSLTAAFAEALRGFYGTKKVKITLSSNITNTTRTFNNTDDLIREIIDARVFGGMHYRTSGKHGTLIGKKVVKWMNQFYFRPIEER